MRSLLLLIAAGTLFGTFLAASHKRGRALATNQARAVARLRALAGEEADLPVERDGYHFEQAAGVLLARPVRPGKDGVSWYATRDGATVWEYDTVLFMAPRGVPDPAPLSRYLDLVDSKRARADIPYGWRLVQPNTMAR